MKNRMKYTCLLWALLATLPTLAQVTPDQDPSVTVKDGIWMKKTATDNNDGTYTLNLQTYVQGEEDVKESIQPLDIIVLFDRSSSMQYQYVQKGEPLSGSTILSSDANTVYMVVYPDGTKKYLKCVYSRGENTYGRYYYYRELKNGYYTTSWSYNTGDKSNLTSSIYYDNALTVSSLVGDSGAKIYATDSRLNVLKVSVNAFLDAVYANNIGNVTHRVAIIPYCASVDKSETNNSWSKFYDVSSGVRTLKNAVNGISGASGTRSDLAMEQAYDLLGSARPNAKKVVIFFTDGEPTNSTKINDKTVGGFNVQTAYDAVRMAHAIKMDTKVSETISRPSSNTSTSLSGRGATIYSVAMLSEKKTGFESNWSTEYLGVRSFLHFVSSNYQDYPECWGNPILSRPNDYQAATYSNDTKYFKWDTDGTFNDHEGAEEPHDYYRYTDGQELEGIFGDIAEETTGGAYANLDVNSTVMVDVLTDKFVFPTTEASQFKLYTCDIDQTNSDASHYEWEKENGIEKWTLWQPWTEPEFQYAKDENNKLIYDFDGNGNVTIDDFIMVNKGPVTIEDEQDYVEINGFDFAKYYVGVVKENGAFDHWHEGKKLIIEFTINVNPANPGGVLQTTNDPRSGVYSKDEGETNYTAKAKYAEPVVNLPYLLIYKKGLQVGESATFKVTKLKPKKRDTDPDVVDADVPFSANVIITRENASQSDDAGPMADTPELLQVPHALIKLAFTGLYKVEETSWAWAYEHGGPQYQVVNTQLESGNQKFVVYEFTNTPKTTVGDNKEVPDHAESFKINPLGRAGKNNTGEGTVPSEDDDIDEEL